PRGDGVPPKWAMRSAAAVSLRHTPTPVSTRCFSTASACASSGWVRISTHARTSVVRLPVPRSLIRHRGPGRRRGSVRQVETGHILVGDDRVGVGVILVVVHRSLLFRIGALAMPGPAPASGYTLAQERMIKDMASERVLASVAKTPRTAEVTV